MFVSFTDIWFSQDSSEFQRVKFLLWLRAKCRKAGYERVRLMGRSTIAKPADASDYALVVECRDRQQYFELLGVIAGLTQGMQERFIRAGGVKWGESLFCDLVEEQVAPGGADNGAGRWSV
jgi:hypothetical protein